VRDHDVALRRLAKLVDVERRMNEVIKPE
jgi:hypothetical protein